MNCLYTLLFLILSVLPLSAQTGEQGGSKVFDGYYDNANGLKKADLKTAMHNIISKANVLGYGSGAGRTWSGFYQTDRYEDNRVRDRYSYDVRYFPSTASAQDARAVNGMNIEHSFPKSWWGGAENQAYKDLFNLMPSESSINSSKSNYPMGKVLDDKHGNGCTKVGTGRAGRESTSLWEPADEWKGDFARSYFYMVTAYSNLTWSGTQALMILQNDEWPTLKEWAYTLFLEWSRQDPVDEIEMNRNEAVFGIQGNRNPFIDFPNLAEYIWGDSIDVAFSVDGSNVDPAPDVSDDSVYSIMAYDATEIVSSIYSCRFDANWGKYKEGATYTLDVYKKNDSGQRTSLEGYPIETKDCSYRVTSGVNANTTYYYDVVVYGENGVVVARSNESVVVIPPVSPVFTVAPSLLSFSATPGEASLASKVVVSLIATESKVTMVQVDGPFELAVTEDAQEWTRELTLTGANVTFYVRLAAVEEEGDIRGDLLVSTKGMETKVIPLLGSVDGQKSFFEGFETGTKGAYDKDSNETDCTMGRWRLKNALLGNADNDTFNGTKSVRMKSPGCVEMLFDKSNGCDSLWFYSGLYYKDKGAVLDVSYSLDRGNTWTVVAAGLPVDTWQRYGFAIQQPGNIRLKFEAKGTSGKRLHVDDIQMNDFRQDEADAVRRAPQYPASCNVWYNLQGERVLSPSLHGIYLHEGKKIVK